MEGLAPSGGPGVPDEGGAGGEGGEEEQAGESDKESCEEIGRGADLEDAIKRGQPEHEGGDKITDERGATHKAPANTTRDVVGEFGLET